MKMKKLFLIGIILCTCHLLFSQNPLSIKTKAGKGIDITQKDSLFSLNFQFRMQNRALYMSTSESDFTPDAFEFRVRRLRLRMDGFVYNPKITYKLQLSFSRGDMDWDVNQNPVNNASPNVVRDAIIYYQAFKNFKLGFGQSKLPGNRQRVISSGSQQFYDRSIVNATFTIDRDFGFFATYSNTYFDLHGAITSGEGRNSNSSNSGLSYTTRLEVRPFGKFKGNNDYSEGDLEREDKPKTAIGITYNYNQNAVRNGGQLGVDLYDTRTIQNLLIDGLVKYKGFALYGEYCQRISSDPITTSGGSIRYIYDGFGALAQASYCFKNNYEIAARLATIQPSRKIYDNSNFNSVNAKRQEQIHLGVSKYLVGHRLKLQTNLLYHVSKDLKNNTKSGAFGAVFQVELGI